jgi:hypothetical protein
MPDLVPDTLFACTMSGLVMEVIDTQLGPVDVNWCDGYQSD